MKEQSVELWHLSEQDFFADLPDEKRDFLSFARKLELKKNAIIFAEGDPGDYCYYLDTGSVKIYRATMMGKEPIFWVRKPGDLFGLAEVIDGKERICTAQTLARSTVYEIHRKDFEQILARYHAMSRKVIAVLGRRIRYLCEQIENLMVCDVTSRVSRLLVYLSFNHLMNLKIEDAPVSFPLTLTQEDIAAMTGSCQQTISETLKGLQEEGLIRVSRREITIMNPLEMLERIYH
ncbi:MAG: Crp/Fnr family transcriptional regulator [Desulfomonile tiedjei]|uniref:Crp/Fnr family transcriptional regulator n=1 Tax=Desulfomonile tiedjei TaxID=2358 RepID=A0A9D6Z2X0_9BACT|nr:Crp/Fnr family transcriptional regulator [Desulfomonile tiedjei]